MSSAVSLFHEKFARLTVTELRGRASGKINDVVARHVRPASLTQNRTNRPDLTANVER